jgi:hypothetical protein
VTLFLGY